MDETVKNLAKAFIGESQARNRYTIYSKIAKKEGYEQIADIFLETANHEKQHAKWLFRLINQLKEDTNEDLSEITVKAGAPTVLENTEENLKASMEGEHYENTEMYPEFADVAEKEGHQDIANRLKSIAKAEKHHEERYKELLALVRDEKIFKKDQEVQWTCRKCGYIHKGNKPPAKCPSCDHPPEYFQVKSEQY